MPTAKRRVAEQSERANPVASVHIWRSPSGSTVDMVVVTHLSAYAAIHEQAARSLPNETGGFLVGRVATDHRDGSWHLEIEDAVPVEPISQDPVHFTFSWRDVDRVRQYREQHGKALIGWYHTHPDLGIFLSDTDLEKTHRVLFSEPFQIALVYDPVRHRAGYFYWEGKQQIDAAPAAWREFDIAVQPEPAVAEVHPATLAAVDAPGPEPSHDATPETSTPQVKAATAVGMKTDAAVAAEAQVPVESSESMPRADETAAWVPEARVRRLFPATTASAPHPTRTSPEVAAIATRDATSRPKLSRRLWWIGLTIGVAALWWALSVLEKAIL